jgi:signal transduction histidine kinase
MGFAIGCGAGLGVVWAYACPWLIGLPWELANPVRPTLFACALGAGLLAVVLTPRYLLGSAGAVRVGGSLGTGGLAGAALASVSAARDLGSAPATALGLCAAGTAIVAGLFCAIGAFRTERRRHRTDGETDGVPIRTLVAGACGALAVGAWALASGHVLGQRHTDADRHALDEARSLCAIAAERTVIGETAPVREIELIAPALAPPGGYLATVDDNGYVLGGVGVGVSPGTPLHIAEGPPTLCRISRRTLPCAVRRLTDGTRVVAAVPVIPIGGDVVLTFGLVGLAVALSALAIGGLVGASTARDLERVSSTIDDLRRGAKDLERTLDLTKPIVVASLDEVGDLAASLGRLRARLAPMLGDYRDSLARSQAADRARDAFLGLVSVELRSPLDEIIAASRALLDARAEPLTPEQRDDVNTVLSASNHLTDLIDEVLDVSAIASGQVTLRVSDVDLGALVTHVAKAQRPLVKSKGVEVRLLITNIISNAVKFTERGAIDVVVRESAGRVEVRVKDTGPGIPADALPKLFREFVQLGSLKQRAHGTGLGLAICKRLVEAHEGEVGAESVVGEGSTFHVSLPKVGPKPQPVSGDDTPVHAVT